ncbi:MAG: AmmeMemoRadiSam system protein A [Acidobacteriota bacterium]
MELAHLPETAGPVLLGLARDALRTRLLDAPAASAPTEPWLDAALACFVTLTVDGELRGCIGGLRPGDRLRDEVPRKAVQAALEDPRFSPLPPSEIDAVRLEVSVLGPLEPLSVGSRSELEAALVPGRDGVLLEAGHRQGTFLPQVWDNLPTPTRFLDALWRKTGLGSREWPAELRVLRYGVRCWEEPEDRS